LYAYCKFLRDIIVTSKHIHSIFTVMNPNKEYHDLLLSCM